MSSASTAARPAFVTIAIRPLSLGRVATTHTRFPNFGKAESFCRRGLTDGLGVLPDGQRKGLWPEILKPGWSQRVGAKRRPMTGSA